MGFIRFKVFKLMTQLQKIHLTKLLQQHISNICELEFAEYGKANALCEFTKCLAEKYFTTSMLYRINLQQISFIQDSNNKKNGARRWNQSIQDLLLITQNMLAELEINYIGNIYNEEGKKIGHSSLQKITTNNIILTIAFLSVSSWLWLFNNLTHWVWLSNHPRRIPILIACQLLLTLLTLLATKMSSRYLEKASILIAILLAVIALL